MNQIKYLISFEGLDGAGKGTQINKLIKEVQDNSNSLFGDKYTTLWLTREPTKITDSGRNISEAIRKGVDGLTASKLFVQDRIEHTKIIKQQLVHSHVFCDRYDLSTLAYQMTQGVDYNKLIEMHQYNNEDGCLIPNVTVFFKIPAKVAFERILSRGEELESYEKIEFLSNLEKNYNFIVEDLQKKGRNIIVVNANQKPENVTKELVEKLSFLK